MRTKLIVSFVAVGLIAGGYAVGQATGRGGGADATSLPGFSTAVSLSHTNSPARSPLFPGDPAFTLTTVNTVAEDGYYLQYVREGEHTGTHYSAPCHFREGKLCAEDLDAADFILPAVVIDVRAEVAADANHVVTRADLQDWEAVPRRDAVGSRGAAVDRVRRVLGTRPGEGPSPPTTTAASPARASASPASRRPPSAG